jgi:hypothetical protein
MGADFSSVQPDEYVDKDQLDAQFCVECKHSLEQQKDTLSIREKELEEANKDRDTLRYDIQSLKQELDATKLQLEHCGVSKEPFDNPDDNSCTSRILIGVIIAFIIGILLGMFIAKRYGYLLDRKLGDILTSDKDNRRNP